MMRLFFDTNIFLDLLMDRSFAEEAEQLIEQVFTGRITGIVADITLLDLAYLAGKQQRDLRDFFRLINRHFVVKGVDNRLFEQALRMESLDLEEALLYTVALEAEADTIVSNGRRFPRREIRVFSSPRCVEELGL